MPESATLSRLRTRLHSVSDPEKARLPARFFKTGPGGYAEGDCFLGIPTPVLRGLVKEHRHLPPETALELVRSPWHEERLCGLLLWIEAWKATRRRGIPPDEGRTRRLGITSLLLGNLAFVDNWDLVDTAIPVLLGEALLERPDPALLERLAGSGNLWERRSAVHATFAAIRSGEYRETLRLCERLLPDPQDLMHKACGWMLREVGKRDLATLRRFLSEHASRMPRTMLRYSIERLDAEERSRWMGRGKL